MGYIPEHAKWYPAEIVQQIAVEGDPRSVHTNWSTAPELIYREHTGWDESAIQEWVSPRADLGVFAPINPSQGPDYRSGDVVEELYRRFPHLEPGDDTSS